MSPKMRIAIVTESFLPQINGVTNSVLRVLEHLKSQGHEALVIAPESIDAPREYSGFRIKRVPSLEMKGLIPLGFPQRALEPLIDGFAPDVIHLASPIFLGKYATKIAQNLNIPTLSIYQTDVAGFARHYGLTVAHNSLKKWVANKVLDVRDDVQLVIVGDGPARSRLEKHLPNARFVGYQSGEDLARYYASLDIFVHTGAHETFCQSIQEALASGVPVIAPNSGGPLDLVKHGWTGYLINTADSVALNQNVNNLLNKHEPAILRERTRASVIDNSWDLVNSQLMNHYRELIQLSDQRMKENVA